MYSGQNLTTDNSDLIYLRKALGFYLRRARERAGFSLRELEQRCGVSDSEIYKIESELQGCRLESFVRICAALSVPCGQILDHVVGANWAHYEGVIKTNPIFLKITGDYKSVRPLMAVNFAMLTAFAAHLLRCSHPISKAEQTEYPDDLIRSAFISFAKKVEKLTDNLERLSILAALEQEPFVELSKHGLFSPDLLRCFVKSLKAGTLHKETEMTNALGIEVPPHVWMPFLPPTNPSQKET